jgi:hypothetical protein
MNNVISYAILNEEGKVLNFCLWDGDLDKWQPPVNTTAIPMSELPANWEYATPEPVPLFSAEEWLTNQGFSSIRLITLLDLENKLLAVDKVSEKLSSVRAWINFILGSFIQNDEPRDDWPQSPYRFEETVQEAFSLLNT